MELTESARRGTPGVDYIDQPTFLHIPARFGVGRIRVDVAGSLLEDAPDFARGFAGVAFGIADDATTFEAVYLRPLNGAKANPPAERRGRAVQYFAFPEWPFDRLRVTYPVGAYEAAADIGPAEWNTLTVDVERETIRAFVNDHEVLSAPRLGERHVGDVGLFVDIGSRAWFADLLLEPSTSGHRAMVTTESDHR